MPNWCNNIIKISGEESDMKPIYDFFVRAEGLPDEELNVMSYLVPEDEEFESIKESGDFLLSPYSTFWGCKWDFQVNECNGDYTPTTITISPCSAWSPPLPFCQKLSEKYKVDVEITYYEGGCDFAGRSYYSQGEEIENEEYSYREGVYYLDSETFWEDLEGNIEWMFCENPTVTLDDVLGQLYPFVTDEDDIKQITESYNEMKEFYEREEQSESEV